MLDFDHPSLRHSRKESCGNRLLGLKKQRDVCARLTPPNGELRAALKRRRRFFCGFCFWKSTIGVTVFLCRLYDSTSPAERGWLLPQAGGNAPHRPARRGARSAPLTVRAFSTRCNGRLRARLRSPIGGRRKAAARPDGKFSALQSL